jgi:hypothetical protein
VNYSALGLPLVEARCDWITCSSIPGDVGKRLIDFAEGLLEMEVKLGSKREHYQMHGYYGFQSRHVRYGWGVAGGLAVLSGDLAGEHVNSLADLANHWSRVDYCVTVRDERCRIRPPDYYYTIKSKLEQRPNGHPVMGQYREVWGGNTFYTGRRISPYYCRCYNKHEESKGDYPPGSWRWEVEMKRHASEGAQARAKDGGLTAGYIASFVANEYTRWGLPVPWNPSEEVKRDPQVRHRLDADRKLDWLGSSIRPTVEFVQEARGTPKVLEALGLPHLAYDHHRLAVEAPGTNGVRSLSKDVDRAESTPRSRSTSSR